MKINSAIAVAAIAAVTFAATAVIAQQDPIAARKALMKANGADARTAAGMAKGDTPFDLAVAQKIFANYAEAGAKLPGLFPANSKTGGDTAASPKIWDDMAGFKAASDKFAADAKAAGASVKDLDSFKAGFGAVSRNCGSCHETYRIKKS